MLNFVIALHSEARPLIERYGLKQVAEAAPFRHYSHDAIHLVLSGPGKVAAAAATAYLGGLQATRGTAVWLNVGIAGHGRHPVNTPLLAHQILDRATGSTYYPAFTFRPPSSTDSVETVDQPEDQYPDNRAYDMEASGFFPTACRFASAELVHSFKVVSDNPQAPAEYINKKQVEALIANHLDRIDQFIEQLEPFRAQLDITRQAPPLYAELVQSYHFTATQRHQLHRLLAVLVLSSPADASQLLGLQDGRAVLRHLEERCQNPVLL